MATGTTTYGDINQRTAAWAANEMLSHAEPILVLQKFGASKPMPKNKADNVKFRRVIPFDPATTPLQEGVTPTAQKMRYEDVPATLQQYGRPIIITDRVADLAEDPVLANASEQAGEQAAETLEAVTWGVIKAGTNVHYTNGAARNAVNTAITLAKQRRVTRNLKAQKAKKITRILSGSTKFQTRPVEASYVAVAHTDCENDIRGLAGFTPTSEYGSMQTLCPEELGSVDDVRYVLSPDLDPFADDGGTYNGSGSDMVSTSGTSADVYPIIYIGRESYGVVPLKGASAITPMVVNVNQPSKSDPMGQRGYVSWKTYYTAVRLNESWMARLEAAVLEL